jgi:hypothetical protein
MSPVPGTAAAPLPAAPDRFDPPPSRSPAARLRVAAIGLALGAGLLAGCVSIQPPQPWEKGDLARPQMSMDRDPLEARFTSHIYFSKEASSGGDGVGGGGCGCN